MLSDKARFLKIHANLPINLRKDIILVLQDHGPITWDVAYLEVENNTKLGNSILKKLKELQII